MNGIQQNIISVEWHVGLEEKEKCEGVMVCSVILCMFSILPNSVSTCGAKERNRRTETVKKITSHRNKRHYRETKWKSCTDSERRSEKVLICVLQAALHQLSEQQGFPEARGRTTYLLFSSLTAITLPAAVIKNYTVAFSSLHLFVYI